MDTFPKQPFDYTSAHRPVLTPLSDIPAPESPATTAPQAPASKPQGSVIIGIAKALSGIFSPLLMPTYAFIIAMWLTPLANLPEGVRLIFSLVILGLTAAMPMGVIIAMMRFGKVSDAAISDRRQRPIPYIVTMVCYLIAAWYIGHQLGVFWIVRFFCAAGIVVCLQTIINIWWKISAHMASMGGLCAFIFFLASHSLLIVPSMPWIYGAIILSGAVGSSRLILNRHTPAQVFIGFFLAFIIVTIVVS